MLSSRFIKSLASSSKPSVSYLARTVNNDNRTREINVTKASVTSKVVTNPMVNFPVPDDQIWRIETLNVRQQSLLLGLLLGKV